MCREHELLLIDNALHTDGFRSTEQTVSWPQILQNWLHPRSSSTTVTFNRRYAALRGTVLWCGAMEPAPPVAVCVCVWGGGHLQSGRTPDHTRLWNFQGSFRSNGLDAGGRTGDEWTSLPQAFKEAGWITAGCGKACLLICTTHTHTHTHTHTRTIGVAAAMTGTRLLQTPILGVSPAQAMTLQPFHSHFLSFSDVPSRVSTELGLGVLVDAATGRRR